MTVLYECRVILPDAEEKTPDDYLTIRSFEIQLAKRFGGFTLTKGEGAWVHPETGYVIKEPVRVYDVANRASCGVQDDALRALILTAGAALGKHSVYYRDYIGRVNILSIADEDIDPSLLDA